MTNLQKGIILAFLTALISGASNFFNKIVLVKTGDPLVFTTLKNSFVGLFLLPILFLNWKNLHCKKSVTKHWLGLTSIALIGGSLAFMLYFTGLVQTSAATASFIHKTLFIWVAFLAIPFLKEKFSYLQLAGFTLLILGSFLFPGAINFQFSRGELMVLAATLLWALENIIAKYILKSVNVSLVTGARMILGSMILISIVLFQNKLGLILQLTLSQWLFILISSCLLFGYVTFWYRALKLIPVSVAASILILASPVTNLLTSIFITKQLNFPIMINLGFFLAGSSLIVLATWKKHAWQ